MIVVDDGSTDETGLRAEELLAATFPLLRVLRLHDNAGKGAAVRLGTAAATAPVVLFMDADMSVDPIQIPRLVKAIGPADVAIGSRSHEESVVENDGVQRIIMGRTFNMLVSAVTNMPFRDTQCGFKAFRTPLARVLFHLMRVQRFAFRRGNALSGPPNAHGDHRGRGALARDRSEYCAVGCRPAFDGARPSDHPQETRVAEPSRVGDYLQRRRAAAVTVSDRRRADYRALGPNFPIVIVSDEESLVLLPLCDPVEVQTVAGRLKHLPTQLSVRERSVSFSQLTEFAPFKWVDGENDGFVVSSHANSKGLVTRMPTDGWASLRTNQSNQSQPMMSRHRV